MVTVQHSSTLTHRTIKPAGLKPRQPRSLKKSSSSDSKSTRSSSIDRTKSSLNTDRNTPLGSLANKFGKWKRRMSNSSQKSTPRKDKNFESIDNNNMKTKVAVRRSTRSKPSPESFDARSNRSSYSKQSRSVDYEYNDSMYEQVVDGMSKMTSTSRGDDQTVGTASITQPSYSHDDGSTIVSEITTDSSYNFHSFNVGDKKFTVDRRYSMIRTVGSGAYGVVISAKDFVSDTSVAIKMVPKAFHDEIDAKRILREIKLLKHFNHENIISIVDMMPPLARNVEDFKDVYIVTDLMETDLHRIIYSKQSLSLDHVQYFLYQILRAIKYLHSANILHRDLKPSNLLVNSNCDLKVCDFGLARGISSTHDEELDAGNGGSMLLTEYVVTRWYRAPEIMLACHEYSKPIDIWSIGCIFAELLNRKPYLAGDDYIDQLTLITEKLGKPSERDMDFVTSEKAKRFLRKLPVKDPVPLSKQFPRASPEAIDLLSSMLQIHPRKRIDVSEALAHPFFASLHSPESEPVAHAPFNFDFENEKLHRVRLQELIWAECGEFRPSCLPVPTRMDDARRDFYQRRQFHS
mmetsp:Transcript_22158/g.33736  ORF Transcript_22158/g.33736 Transcript_22158/m.33736 type:complete len:575 (-) Transcript_22158:230-1954(-)